MRVQLTKAIYSDPPGPGRLRAGRWIATTPGELQSGDVYWPNASSFVLPTGPVITVTGVDSVSG